MQARDMYLCAASADATLQPPRDIADAFCAGRPPWEKADVTLTDDVHSCENMKIRVLNAGHQVQVLQVQHAFDGSSRHPDFFLPILRDALTAHVHRAARRRQHDRRE